MDRPPAEQHVAALVFMRMAKAIRDGIVEAPEKMPAALKGELGRLLGELNDTGTISPSNYDEALQRRVARQQARRNIENPEFVQLSTQYLREELDRLVKSGEFIEFIGDDGMLEWDWAGG